MSLYNRYTMETYTGLQWGEYEVKSKGDDTITVIKANFDRKIVERAYAKTFVNGKDVPAKDFNNVSHGLGQIAKYLKWGTLEDIDFCSTQTIRVKDDCYHIVRQLPRFLTTTVWSRKAMSFNADD